MESKLLDILVCPICKGNLKYRKAAGELICRGCRLAYAITSDGIPILLEDEARALSDDDLAHL